MPEPILVALSSCPDEESAARIAGALVSEGLATCVNRIAGVRSSYIWDGSLKEDAEILLIIKTTAARLPEVTARLQALHPYDLPELVALEAVGGNEAYLDWVREGVQRRSESRE